MSDPGSPLHPLFLLHLHKCGGTTFVQAAAANGHRFASPGRCGLPLGNGGWVVTEDPMGEARGEPWPFWALTRRRALFGIQGMLAAGVDCIVQEYGVYDPVLWKGFFKAMCIRHPVNRIYSDFLHSQDEEKIPARTGFAEWLDSGGMPRDWETMFTDQIGLGDVSCAIQRLREFDAIIVQERYSLAPMAEYGWTSLDAEAHFKSWTPRRSETGLDVLGSHPAALRLLEQRCGGDIEIYGEAVRQAGFPTGGA